MAWHIAIDEPRSFQMLLPATIPQALDHGARLGREAAYLAGGCDLLEKLKTQRSGYRYLINLKTIPSLRGIEIREGAIRIGALTTLGEIERSAGLRSAVPGLAAAAARVATPQIRNMGTLGGNLLQDCRCSYYRGPWYCYRAGGIVCDARHGIHAEHALFGADRCMAVSPSDTAPMLVALDALATVEGPEGSRQRPVADLFVLPSENIRALHRLRRDEILTAIEIPRAAGRRSVFLKYAQRNSWDFAIASVAAALTHAGGVVRDCRMVLGAVAATPWRSRAAEEALEGRPLSPGAIEAAARAAVEGAQPLAQNEFKVALVRKLVRAVLGELARE